MTDHHLDDDALDPVLVERFRLLERVQPPANPFGQARTSRPAAAVEPLAPRAERPGWSRVLAVAAVLLVGGVAAVVLVSLAGGERAGISTSDPAGDGSRESSNGASDGSPDGDGSTDRAILDVEAGGALDEQGGADRIEDGTIDPSSPTTSNAGSAEPSSTGSSGTTSTSTTETSGTSPVTNRSSSTTTRSTSPSSAVPTTQSSSTSITLNPGKDVIVTIQGTVTEVFTDCVSHLELGPQGEVITGGQVSCDGGSWIVVEGNRIQTSSGFVADDLAFDRHDPDLRPGEQVTVTVLSPPGGQLTLDCPICQISIG